VDIVDGRRSIAMIDKALWHIHTYTQEHKQTGERKEPTRRNNAFCRSAFFAPQSMAYAQYNEHNTTEHEREREERDQLGV
jgi:hypothetical protein